jgi:hypothetical protein
MTETSESWGKILELIESSLKIPRRTIELIAVKDILTLCASGVANHKIASVLDLDVFYVKSVLIEFIDFQGWVYDLDINPYTIYSNLRTRDYPEDHQELMQDFKKEISIISPYMNDEVLVKNAFVISQKLWNIEQEIEKDWK